MIRVMVGICTGENARSASFYSQISMLQQPMGTCIKFVHGLEIARARNMIVEAAITQGCSHVFFVDDDVVMPPDTLIKLICHNKDCITGLMLRRNFPHQPMLFDRFEGDNAIIRFLSKKDKGLVRIVASGLGCCLIKCKVFSKLDEPFFRLGEMESDKLGEDLGFFWRVEGIGLEHWCDLDSPVGHMTTVTVRPQFDDNWLVTYDTNGSDRVMFPQVNYGTD